MSDSRTPDADIGAIIGGAAADDRAKNPVNGAADADRLAERLDLLVADFGQWTEYKAASVEYVREFTTEIKWHRRTRALVVSVCGLLIVAFAVLLIVVLWNAQTIFGNDPGHSLTALIVGTIGGSVIISIAALKGAFATVKDRNEGLPMPDHMKELVDVGKNLFKG